MGLIVLEVLFLLGQTQTRDKQTWSLSRGGTHQLYVSSDAGQGPSGLCCRWGRVSCSAICVHPVFCFRAFL